MSRISLLISVLFCLANMYVSAQELVTKESFFPKHRRLPKNYKQEISENKWEYRGTYRSDNGKTVLPDSPQPAVVVFEKGDSYRRIKGKKIISDNRSDTQKIIYLDETTLILEARDEKGRYRSLYRKRKAGKISTFVIKKQHEAEHF